MKTPVPFPLSKEQREEMKAQVATYLANELDVEVGQLQADMFVDFISQKLGQYYYNLGVIEAMKEMQHKAEDLVLLLKDE